MIKLKRQWKDQFKSLFYYSYLSSYKEDNKPNSKFRNDFSDKGKKLQKDTKGCEIIRAISMLEVSYRYSP